MFGKGKSHNRLGRLTQVSASIASHNCIALFIELSCQFVNAYVDLEWHLEVLVFVHHFEHVSLLLGPLDGPVQLLAQHLFKGEFWVEGEGLRHDHLVDDVRADASLHELAGVVLESVHLLHAHQRGVVQDGDCE